MKKQIMTNLSSVIRKAALGIGFASLVAFSFIPARANAQDPSPSGVVIRYIGSINNQPVFQIEFENQNAEAYNVSIKDEVGNTLYNEKFKDKKFSKKFQFERSTTDDMKLTFTLSGQKQRLTQVFEVNTSVRTVEDVVVTKL